MKRILTSALILLMGQTLAAQTLFTYGKNGIVDKEEFLAAFNKNNPEDKSLQAKKEYLEQFYIPFKLKVQAAHDMHLDTLPFFKHELDNYKHQVLDDNLIADSAVRALCAEAYTRSLRDIRLSHIFVPFDDAYVLPDSYIHPEPEDTTAAYRKITSAYNTLLAGAGFAETARQYSGDPSAKINAGDLGFITVFSLPYQLENIAYHLEKGKFSAPYKSKGGYHILFKTDERPAFGTIKGAQLLLAFPPGITAGEKQILRVRADSLYNVLRTGADFDLLTRKYSSDFNAAMTGGALNPDFRIGRYDHNFETAVTALTQDGDITKPFETAYGIHIVKRDGRIPVSTDSMQALAAFRPQVLSDPRISITNELEEKRILRLVGYKDLFNNDDLLWTITQGVVYGDGSELPNEITASTAIFAVGNETRSLKDWVDYIQTIKNNYRAGTSIPYATLMKHYTTVTAKKYYRDNLEFYSPAFRKQLKEFEEGNLFFEIMGRQVWNKGSDDEKKLTKFYKRNQSQYIWGESINAILFTATDKNGAADIKADPQTFVNNWRTISETPNGNIIADSARFETAFVPGYNSSMPVNSLSVLSEPVADGPASMLFIISKQEGGSPKTFTEARGFVVNDYQEELDKKWQKSLRKKYRVVVNEPLLNSL